MVGEKLALRHSINYVEAILKQDITWFDMLNAGEVTAEVSNLCTQVLRLLTCLPCYST